LEGANDSDASNLLASALIAAGRAGTPVFAQKSGGVLKVHRQDSPASMSILEEATYSTVVSIMGVMKNLVMYKQDEPQNSVKSIAPDLATGWYWSEDGTELTFRWRHGFRHCLPMTISSREWEYCA
jgi:peptide/nickel transport system substrate-binding protein